MHQAYFSYYCAETEVKREKPPISDQYDSICSENRKQRYREMSVGALQTGTTIDGSWVYNLVSHEVRWIR